MTEAEKVLTPKCPACDAPPQIKVGNEQWFCGNDDCELLMWNPQESRTDLLADIAAQKGSPENT